MNLNRELSPNSVFWLFVLAIVFLIGIQTYVHRGDKIVYMVPAFDSAYVHGKIRYLKMEHGFLTLSTGRDTFWFYPRSNPQSASDRDMSLFASEGDTISKLPFSDTIFLTRQGTLHFWLLTREY